MDEDEERLAEYAASLADAVEAAVSTWVHRVVRLRASAAGVVVDDAAVGGAADRATSEVDERLRRLLAADIDDQRTNPLSILRGAVRYPTEVLRDAGVPPVDRDADAVRLFPDDLYDLTPGSFADVDPTLHEPGILWGAAKAHVHLRRHRPRRASTPTTPRPPDPQ